MKTYNFLKDAIDICRIEKPMTVIIAPDKIIYEYSKVIKILYSDKIEYLYNNLRMSIPRDCSERATL